MDWQQLVSLLIVAAVAALFVWRKFRRRTFSFERDTHCGCSAAGHSATQGSIVFRTRKGERPTVLMKMR
jgi:ABC-type nickel/cobalt efflux system permease component RcnA